MYIRDIGVSFIEKDIFSSQRNRRVICSYKTKGFVILEQIKSRDNFRCLNDFMISVNVGLAGRDG